MIFIIDDDSEDVELITTAFKEVNTKEEIQTFESASEFLRFINGREFQKAPFYIITDLKMHGTDGIQLVESLRKIDSYRSVPIVMLSTSNLNYDIERAYKSGVNSYFIKPDTFNGWKTIVATIDAWINRWNEATGSPLIPQCEEK